jgi:hypothetical protein
MVEVDAVQVAQDVPSIARHGADERERERAGLQRAAQELDQRQRGSTNTPGELDTLMERWRRVTSPVEERAAEQVQIQHGLAAADLQVEGVQLGGQRALSAPHLGDTAGGSGEELDRFLPGGLSERRQRRDRQPQGRQLHGQRDQEGHCAPQQLLLWLVLGPAAARHVLQRMRRVAA